MSTKGNTDAYNVTALEFFKKSAQEMFPQNFGEMPTD